MGTVSSVLKAITSVQNHIPMNVAMSSSVFKSSQEFYRQPLPRICVPFSSPEGKRLFREALLAGHMESYFALADQLCTQDEPAFCGLATLVMVLNAFEMDPGRVWKRPWRWYHESMLKCCIPPDILTEGIVMDKFAEIARCHGLDVDIHRVHESDDLNAFRDVVSRMTSTDTEGFLVACYLRGSLGQTGNGHFAAVGGYHPQRELVFLFDTARFKYPPHWVPIARLWDGMGRVDPVTGMPRGYMIITRSALFHPPDTTLAPAPHVDVSSLILFGVSDSACQAFLSPAALCDIYSVGYRLRLVADNWMEWLTSSGSKHDSSNLATKAAQFLLDACARHAPRNFFFTLRPLADGNVTELDKQHRLLRELLVSPLGQAVTNVVTAIPTDLFKWFTTNGTFQLVMCHSFSLTQNAYRDFRCPFVELSDHGLRLSLLVTCFIYSFPYSQMNSQNVSPDPSRGHILQEFLHDSGLSEFTKSELTVLQSAMWSLIASGIHPKQAFNLCCGRRARKHACHA